MILDFHKWYKKHYIHSSVILVSNQIKTIFYISSLNGEIKERNWFYYKRLDFLMVLFAILSAYAKKVDSIVLLISLSIYILCKIVKFFGTVHFIQNQFRYWRNYTSVGQMINISGLVGYLIHNKLQDWKSIEK